MSDSRPFVAGVDSSTQSCKVVIYDPASGKIIREGRASHPEGSEVDPQAWWEAFLEAARIMSAREIAPTIVSPAVHAQKARDFARTDQK